MTTELYRHTQPGTLMRILLGIATLGGAIALILPGSRCPPGAFAVLCLVIFIMLLSSYLFHSLTVVVTDEVIEIRFGPGLIRKTYPMSGLISCNIVRNSWLYGWGIHWCGKAGWLYNVSGFDAVEIVFKDGKKARIGTDAPRELAAAINEHIRSRQGGR